MAQEVFWRRKALHEMTRPEWESLCDGCALCCLHKVEDEDTEEVFYTTVVCHLLDMDNCQCTEYERRCELVPSCIRLQPEDVENFDWLPFTCSYRLIHEKRDLPDWHPLLTGERQSVIEANASVLSVYEVKDNEIHEDQLIDYVLDED
ncbi:YcgN family cysteine cluster protein [Marinobacterium marinum]|uniref:YcgN family cysteine cluster protein n=1 Tax=Marinobacterium marinum TaxID=2756129 RepID=A0A7W2A9Y2_9GAMM|nr:YcgN family cysteine cluster protein [Marinobacterium marinum]MBA4501251.1 YcgN family cysteine cluster protein [Marinobacterium marinum]